MTPARTYWGFVVFAVLLAPRHNLDRGHKTGYNIYTARRVEEYTKPGKNN